MKQDIQELKTWIQAHPWQSRFFTLGIAILILELSLLLHYGLEALSKSLQ